MRPKLIEQFGYKNPMQVPRLDKIVLNMGIGEATADSKLVQVAVAELEKIAGQKVVITKARKAIATFKIRENLAIGAKVTLRKTRMYEFLDRLITIALPRVRDFRGLSERSFDGNGNYAMGIKEHIIFPEIDYDKIDRVWGLDVIICTTAKTDEEARALIEAFNFPFRKQHPQAGGLSEQTGSTEVAHMAKTSSVEKNEKAQAAGEEIRGQARAPEGDHARTRRCRWKSASRRSSSFAQCRAIRRRPASATAANSPAGRGPSTGN